MSTHRTLKQVELVLQPGTLSQIRDYLFDDLSNEYACYLLCGHHKVKDRLRLLGCYLIIPNHDDYIHHSIASVTLKKEILESLLQECIRLNLSLIDIHSHPFSTSSVMFSGTDDADEQEKADWFKENLPSSYYGSIVMGRESQVARLHASDKKRAFELPLSIRSIEFPLLKDAQDKISNLETEPDDKEIFDRQIRAFTKEGQKLISQVKVGIAGLGGLGAGIAIELARLGVRNFCLVDNDIAELSNLNRVEGMTRLDTRMNNPKVEIAARNIMAINPNATCKRIKGDITKAQNWKQLRDVDLIVTSTDNNLSRLILNMISLMYLIPQVSVGTLITTEKGRLDGGWGHVYTMIPGSQPCLLCAQIINTTEAYYELCSIEHRKEALANGYIENFLEPSPAVVHLNGMLINMTVLEIHNLLTGFKPLQSHLMYSMLDQEIWHMDVDDRSCAVCAPGGGFVGHGDLAEDPLKSFVKSF